nr:metallophosphoesterase [Acuticoccus mangrovi]
MAHLSDPHLAPLPRPSPQALMSKRIFGYLNWVKNRNTALGRTILDRLVADMKSRAPDHIAVTGDLVNIALDEEFDNAADWLASLGDPADVTMVPGNHDAYVPGAAKKATARWAPFIDGDVTRGFPLCRRRGPIVLIGVSTAVATPPLIASGRVGPVQLSSLAALLDRHDDAYKVVMIHHPPDASLASGSRGLTDDQAVRDVLAAGCADLVLHGHTHKPSLRYLETARGRAAIVGVPSASSDGSHHPLASYALIDIDSRQNTVRLTRRGLESADGPFKTLSTEDLAPTPAVV